ncbi:alpha/beta hydrolase [Streptomyces sp. NBC_00448]|uniref:alpha/beta hydrolase n=1 Tax=Streptomyces sp. NBC_00448 TaxID=2903652 RepID=UPI002E22F6B2
MGSNGLINVAVAVVVLIWLLSRQLSTRPVRERSRLGLVLIVVGVIETVSFTSQHSLSGRDVSLLALSLAIGVALAAVRGFTLSVWQEGGRTLRKGGPLTAVLWIAGSPQNVWPCAFWATPTSDRAPAPSPRGPANILLVQNTADPSTPVAGARQTLRAFGHRAAMVTVNAAGHGVDTSHGCVAAAVTRFFIQLRQPRSGTCPAAD